MPSNPYNPNNPILVTGVAGFIGFSVARALLEAGYSVVGLDNLNDYYDVTLKKARLEQLIQSSSKVESKRFQFEKIDICHIDDLKALFQKHSFKTVIHLAAQAGVRYSLENPFAYVQSNLVGFLNILEMCRGLSIEHLIYASSSSVYGSEPGLGKGAFSIHQPAVHPLSLYAATKRSNELMAHSYSHLYQLPTTGLRFFTVYGPWGRPDMALFKFVKAILSDQPVVLYNSGQHQRSFTYIDDIVSGILKLVSLPFSQQPSQQDHDPGFSQAPWRLFNMGHAEPVELETFVQIIEKLLNKTARRQYVSLQPGDVIKTWADTQELQTLVGIQPLIPVEQGIQRFIDWYCSFYTS